MWTTQGHRSHLHSRNNKYKSQSHVDIEAKSGAAANAATSAHFSPLQSTLNHPQVQPTRQQISPSTSTRCERIVGHLPTTLVEAQARSARWLSVPSAGCCLLIIFCTIIA
jgi:hypothetical protein